MSKTPGEIIIGLREKYGDTQKQLADKLGISQSMLCQMERGSKNITHPMLVQISKVYKEDPKVFF